MQINITNTTIAPTAIDVYLESIVLVRLLVLGLELGAVVVEEVVVVVAMDVYCIAYVANYM